MVVYHISYIGDSVKINNFTIPSIWLRFITCPYPIFICLSFNISLNSFFGIILLYFWVQINAIPMCVIVQHLSWPYVLHDATTNHIYDSILLLRNFAKPFLVGQSGRHVGVRYYDFFPSEWLWHYFCYVWPCPSFSMIYNY